MGVTALFFCSLFNEIRTFLKCLHTKSLKFPVPSVEINNFILKRVIFYEKFSLASFYIMLNFKIAEPKVVKFINQKSFKIHVFRDSVPMKMLTNFNPLSWYKKRAFINFFNLWITIGCSFPQVFQNIWVFLKLQYNGIFLKNHYDSEKLLTFGGFWMVSTVTSPRKDPPLPSCGASLSCLSNPDCFASKPSRNMDFYQDLLHKGHWGCILNSFLLRKFCDITWNVEENEILREIFRVVSRFPGYFSCYMTESRLPLGQCIYTIQ